MTGGFAKSTTFTGLAFSGGSERAALPVLTAGGASAERDWGYAARQHRKIRAMQSNAAFMKRFPERSYKLLERFPLIWTHAVQRIFQSKLRPLLARTQKNFPVASSENENFAAVADFPALYARRGRDVLVHHKTLVTEIFHRVGLNREARAGRHS